LAPNENGEDFQIPEPRDPALDLKKGETVSKFKQIVFEKQIDAYVKREAKLQSNKQNAYSLAFGQCSELMKSKLKSSNRFDAVNKKRNVNELLDLIKSITFKFEDQKYLPLSIHNSKSTFHSFRQGNMTNAQYLEKFNNLVDITSSYEGNLHDMAITEMISQRKFKKGYRELDDKQFQAADEEAKEMYLACAFIVHADNKRYGKLKEDLENSYTRGNDDYPKNRVKAYQILNEYKQWRPPTNQVSEALAVAFAQRDTKNRKTNTNENSNSSDNDDYNPKLECYRCGKKGYMTSTCPKCNPNGGDESDPDDHTSDDNDHEPKTTNRRAKTKKKKKKAVTLAQDADDDDSDTSGFGFFQHEHKGDDLRNCILLDNQSTHDVFCNKHLVRDIRKADHELTIKSNVNKTTIKQVATLKGYGQVWFDPKSRTNILSLKNVKKKYSVSYHSDQSDAFIVHRTNEADMHFIMHEDGLHYYDASGFIKQSKPANKKNIKITGVKHKITGVHPTPPQSNEDDHESDNESQASQVTTTANSNNYYAVLSDI